MAAGRRQPLDGSTRRRLYLFRHGAVDYVDASGNWVDDPDQVDLNDRGRGQAVAMAEAFGDVPVDRAICSGLRRTRQTAEIVLGARDLTVTDNPEFEEIRPQKGETNPDFDLLDDIAFTHWRADDPDARFLGGERYADFYQRIAAAAETLLADAGWRDIAVFAHGATNAALLGWVTGVGKAAFGTFDQQPCCLNVVDFDERDGRVLRKTVRALNMTAEDPVKAGRHAGDLELLAGYLKRIVSAA